LGERGLGSPVQNGVVFTGAFSVTVTGYRYRGANIPTPCPHRQQRLSDPPTHVTPTRKGPNC